MEWGYIGIKGDRDRIKTRGQTVSHRPGRLLLHRAGHLLTFFLNLRSSRYRPMVPPTKPKPRWDVHFQCDAVRMKRTPGATSMQKGYAGAPSP